MIRYYTEKEGNKKAQVVFQDETGVYIYNYKTKVVVLRDEVRNVWANMPEWGRVRQISTSDKSYLQFIREYERPAQVNWKPTEIKEIDISFDNFVAKIKKEKFV